MGKHDDKTARAAHIKRHTVGTSNEISFSVLDAAKNALDGEKGGGEKKRAFPFGGIPLFTLARKKKAVSTPTKEQGLPLSTGDFVSVDSVEVPTGTPQPAAPAPATAARGLSGGAGTYASGKAMPHGADALGGVLGGTAVWPAPAEEVARRKTTRKRRRLLAYTLAFAVGAAVIGGAGWWLYQGHQEQQARIGELDQALARIEEADATIAPLNDALSELFDLPAGQVAQEELAAELSACEEGLPAASDALAQAAALAQGARDGMADSVEREAANQAVSAIEARSAMIVSGGKVVADARAAASAAAQAQEGWDLLLQADTLAREAAQMVTETTDENVSASMEKTNQALALFQQADAAFSTAVDVYPAADFSPYRAYLSKRIEAMGFAAAANEAFLARDKEGVIAQNDAYNAADAEAASLAADLPDDPVGMVAAASSEAASEARNAYATACSQAAAADAFLRDYLGTTSK